MSRRAIFIVLAVVAFVVVASLIVRRRPATSRTTQPPAPALPPVQQPPGTTKSVSWSDQLVSAQVTGTTALCQRAGGSPEACRVAGQGMGIYIDAHKKTASWVYDNTVGRLF
jgi:hypothetical protein